MKNLNYFKVIITYLIYYVHIYLTSTQNTHYQFAKITFQIIN